MIKNISSEQIIIWIKKNIQKILILLSLCIFSAVAFIVWEQWEKKKEGELQTQLYQYQKDLKQLIEKEAKKKDTKKESFFEKKSAPVFTQEMRQKALKYEKLIKSQPRNRVAGSFAIDLADFYYQRGEREKAKKLISLFALPEKSSNIYHLAVLQLASYYMNEQNCSSALKLLEALSLNKKASAFHLESDFQQAICLDHLKKYHLAVKKYESIINKAPETYRGRLAEDYKKILLLNKNSGQK